MRTSSPLKKQLFYGNGIGRVEQGGRDWRDRGYGIPGLKEVMRSQGNWRNMQKQSELDGGRKDKSMDTEVDLGMDPNKGPPMVSNSDNLSGPIVTSNVSECSEFGPGPISKSITT
ncbi:hypothetical protein LWI29_012491 [Acer saccharum]|uniref:Uncharacterized protein n=1 Tax=Acer saccharum TaxID=4024 RepID=A0AA39TE21_ACESA|nr:hypothetical protein LWI29_012491 [Acer saccharum]